jgi:NADH-quinone oxidoreductase subunit J
LDFSTFNGDTIILIILLISLIASMLLSVMIRSLVKAAIALSVVSAVLSVIMFILQFTLAAVFELSVCSGLITVLFISTASMTKHKTNEEDLKYSKERKKRFILLPILLLVITVVLVLLWPSVNASWLIKSVSSDLDVKQVLWYDRQIDIIGQIIILLAGAFGIVLLFKERDEK